MVKKIRKFKDKFDKIIRLTSKEIRKINQFGFDEMKEEIMMKKQKLSGKLCESLRHISLHCIQDEKEQKIVELNSLLLMQTFMNFMTKMNEEIYNSMYLDKTKYCFTQHKQQLDNCALNSYNEFFFKTSRIPSVVELIRGSICK